MTSRRIWKLLSRNGCIETGSVPHLADEREWSLIRGSSQTRLLAESQTRKSPPLEDDP